MSDRHPRTLLLDVSLVRHSRGNVPGQAGPVCARDDSRRMRVRLDPERNV
jgi:hypothetical protein